MKPPVSSSKAILANIGVKLKELRIKKGLAQKKLANIVGVSDTHMNLLENNKRGPSKNVLLKIAEALDVKPADFLPDLYESNSSVSTMQDPIVKATLDLPLFYLEFCDGYLGSTGQGTVTIGFGTKHSDLAAVRLNDDTMLPVFSSNDIVIIDKSYQCKTDPRSGAAKLLKTLRSGMYVICHISRVKSSYVDPNKLLRRIEFHENEKYITLQTLNKKDDRVLNVRSDDNINEINVAVLQILGVVMGKKKNFYEYPMGQERL